MFVIPAEWKHPMHGSPRVQAFPAPSYLFPGAGRVASAHFHPQALVPEDQDLLGVLHGLGLAGKSVPVVRRPLHIAEDDDHCWRWDRPSLRSRIPSLVPASSRVLRPPVATLPSCGNKLIHPRMRGGDGGKEPRKEERDSKLCFFTQDRPSDHWMTRRRCISLSPVTHRPSATTLLEAPSASVPLPSAPIFYTSPTFLYKSCNQQEPYILLQKL